MLIDLRGGSSWQVDGEAGPAWRTEKMGPGGWNSCGAEGASRSSRTDCAKRGAASRPWRCRMPRRPAVLPLCPCGIGSKAPDSSFLTIRSRYPGTTLPAATGQRTGSGKWTTDNKSSLPQKLESEHSPDWTEGRTPRSDFLRPAEKAPQVQGPGRGRGAGPRAHLLCQSSRSTHRHEMHLLSSGSRGSVRKNGKQGKLPFCFYKRDYQLLIQKLESNENYITIIFLIIIVFRFTLKCFPGNV